MRWELDAEVGSLYVHLTDAPVARQDEMPDGVVVDVDAEGRAVGVEIVSTWAPFDLPLVARRYELSEEDVASLGFLIGVISHVNVRPDPAALLQADLPTTSAEPARTLCSA